jgi:hypothetical protein
MAELTIHHDHENGTRLTGSSKGDGVLELLQPLGWTWRYYAGVHIRGSRDKFSYRLDLDKAAAALREAGHTVTLAVDDTWRPAAVRQEERGERADNRAERLDERAGKAAGRSQAAYDRSREIGGRMPMGQPILVGHHSESRHRRDITQMDSAMHRSVNEDEYADRLASRANGARSNEKAKHDPRAIMRRIETLKTNVRELERGLGELAERAGTAWQTDDTLRPWQRYALGSVERDQEEITHLEGVLAQHADAGTFVAWGREHFQKGDLVKAGVGHWYPVTRINQKSVSLGGDGWPHTAKWDEIHGRRRDGMQLDRPNGDPWPVELAVKVERWRYLVGLLRCQPHDDATRRQHMHIEWAPRMVHGLDLGAADSEMQAIHDAVSDVGQKRELAAQYLAVYKRLEAGEKVADILASLAPVEIQAPWALPTDREPEPRRAGPGWPATKLPLVAVGDLVAGYYETGNPPRVIRGFTGPVTAISPVKNLHESGEFITITLATGDSRELKVTQWLAVFPAGTWEPEPEPEPEPAPVLNNAIDVMDAIDTDPKLAAEVDARWVDDPEQTIGERMKRMQALGVEVLRENGIPVKQKES